LRLGSVHALRHSFATHLLAEGTNKSMIQKLTGQNDIKTTLRYTHVTQKTLNQLESLIEKIIHKKAGIPSHSLLQ
jgi:site-specific recombinase XerD